MSYCTCPFASCTVAPIADAPTATTEMTSLALGSVSFVNNTDACIFITPPSSYTVIVSAFATGGRFSKFSIPTLFNELPLLNSKWLTPSVCANQLLNRIESVVPTMLSKMSLSTRSASRLFKPRSLPINRVLLPSVSEIMSAPSPR